MNTQPYQPPKCLAKDVAPVCPTENGRPVASFMGSVVPYHTEANVHLLFQRLGSLHASMNVLLFSRTHSLDVVSVYGQYHFSRKRVTALVGGNWNAEYQACDKENKRAH